MTKIDEKQSKNRESQPRDESSSHDNLSIAELLGADTGQPERVDFREDEKESGMVNLAVIMANAEQTAKPTPKSEDLSSAATMGAALLGEAPIVNAIAPSAETSKRTPISEIPQKKKKTGVVLAAAAAVLVVAVALFAAKSGMFDAAPAKADESALNSNEEKQVAVNNPLKEPQQGEAKPEGTVSENDQSLDSDETNNKSRSKKGRIRNHGRRQTGKSKEKPSKTDNKETIEKKAPPRSSDPSTSNKEMNELDSLLSGSSGKTRPSSNSGGGTAATVPSREEVQSVMGPIAARAGDACGKGETGTVQLKITLDSSGAVRQAKAAGQYAGTTAGACVEKFARDAKFSKFEKPSFSFTYPVKLK